jgi:CheY-like chemotaxis protein
MSMERAGYILVVDDDSTIGELIAEVLTDAGLTVFAVLNGTCALSVVAAHLPALWLIDARMPNMSGLEVIEHLRARGAKALPIVVMTVSSQDVEAIRVAGFDCLDKPFDIDDCLRASPAMFPLNCSLSPYPFDTF